MNDLKENAKKEIKVLIVEDSLVLLQAMEFGLKKAGFQVFRAVNGKEGVISIRSNIPNIVLLDIMMPEMNGIEVLKNVKDFKIEKDIKIFMLTNFSAEENVEECMSLGADDYLVKANFTIADIVKKIKETIK